MTKKEHYELRISEDDRSVAYLAVNVGESPRRVARNVRLADLLPGYEGPDVVFDFAEDGVLLGIELVGDDDS